MQIREIYPAADPADLAAIQPVAQAAYTGAMPNFPDVGSARLVMTAADLHTSKAMTLAAFADEHAEVALGYAALRIELADNLELIYGELWVAPDARRRGIGSALHAETLRVAARHNRSLLMWEGPSSTDPGEFAAYHQGKPVERVTRSVLDLHTVDRTRYTALAEPSPANADYTLIRWLDYCPPELVGSYCAAMSAMQDAPMGESVYEITAFTPEKLAAYEESSAILGVRRHVLAAVDQTGEVAGFHAFASYPDEPQTLEVWDTGVVRAHRGHGLGLRIKAAAALWGMEEYPAARWFQTFNNADNAPMLRVNRELGYQASEDWIKFEFTVPKEADVPAGDR
jgi:GNAT superfamily N-acetyltransferase